LEEELLLTSGTPDNAQVLLMILRSNRTILDVLSLLGATFAFAALVLSNYLSMAKA